MVRDGRLELPKAPGLSRLTVPICLSQSRMAETEGIEPNPFQSSTAFETVCVPIRDQLPKFWCLRLESNQRRMAYEATVLPLNHRGDWRREEESNPDQLSPIHRFPNGLARPVARTPSNDARQDSNLHVFSQTQPCWCIPVPPHASNWRRAWESNPATRLLTEFTP